MRLDLLVNDFVYRAVNDGFVVLFEAISSAIIYMSGDIAHAFVHAHRQFREHEERAYNVGLVDRRYSRSSELCRKIKEQVPDFDFWKRPSPRTPTSATISSPTKKSRATGFKPQPIRSTMGIAGTDQGLPG